MTESAVKKPVDGLPGVQQALERAALRAREIAARTGTPLVIFKDGRIQHCPIPPEANGSRQ
jgi:hypothetical protein